MSKIQKQDVKTSAELATAGATDASMIQDTQIYVTANGANEQLATAITDGKVVPNSSITNAKLADMTAATIKGRASGAGTGAPTDLSATQATAVLNEFVGDSGSGGTKGLVKAPVTGDSTKFLKGDGTWATVSGAYSIQEFTASGSFVVPAGVTSLEVLYVGGGGGGGSGGTNGGGTGVQGGGGGAGAQPITTILAVTASDTLTVTIGAGGTGPSAPNTISGTAGGSGGNTTITGTGVDLYAPGGSGGAGGNGNEGGAAPAGGTTYAANNTLLGLPTVSAGGAGAATGTPAGSNGTATSRIFNPSTGGTGLGTPNRGCAGGGGGSGMGKGGNGGNASNVATGNPGAAPAATAYGAAGGGASGNLGGGNGQGGAGGAGRAGFVRFIWGG